MTLPVLGARLIAVAVFIGVSSCSRLVFFSGTKILAGEARFVERKSVGGSHSSLSHTTRSKKTLLSSCREEEGITKAAISGKSRKRSTSRTRRSPRRVGSAAEDSSSNALISSRGAPRKREVAVAVLVIAVTLAVSGFVLNRVFRATQLVEKEPPGTVQGTQELSREVVPEGRAHSEAEKPEAEAEAEPEAEAQREATPKKDDGALRIRIGVVALFVLFLALLSQAPVPEALLQLPAVEIAVFLGTTMIIRFVTALIKELRAPLQARWDATARVLVQSAEDKRKLKKRVDQALQLLAGAREQARLGKPQSLWNAHPLQLHDFRIGSYATSLWLAAAARVGLLTAEESCQRECQRVVHLSDRLRELANVVPTEDNRLFLPDYRKGWDGNFYLPTISNSDREDLIKILVHLHKLLK